MAAVLTEDLIYEILSVVDEIPAGKVASYGQIAKLIGREKNARLVGKVLSRQNITANIRATEWSIMPGGRHRIFTTRRTGF